MSYASKRAVVRDVGQGTGAFLQLGLMFLFFYVVVIYLVGLGLFRLTRWAIRKIRSRNRARRLARNAASTTRIYSSATPHTYNIAPASGSTRTRYPLETTSVGHVRLAGPRPYRKQPTRV